MTETETGLLRRLVIGHKRDGRSRYDPVAKRELIEMALRPGVWVAGLALRYGINANLLRKWMCKHQGRREAGVQVATVATSPAFVPVVPAEAVVRAEWLGLAAHLPNGVRIEFGAVEADSLGDILLQLHALPCSGSTRG
jgi:transposase